MVEPHNLLHVKGNSTKSNLQIPPNGLNRFCFYSLNVFGRPRTGGVSWNSL